jgi:hypothetical protein
MAGPFLADVGCGIPGGDETEPVEYVIHAQVDNFGLPDSGFTDQCCFSDGYVRVAVGG